MAEVSTAGAGARPGATRVVRRAVRTGLARPAAVLGSLLLGLSVTVGLLAGQLAPYDPLAAVGPALAAPSAEHRMGTDDLGRDVWSGVAHGTRTSLVIAGGVGAVVLTIGVLVGAASGYAGGVVDHLLQRFTELVQTLPRFFLALVVLAFFGTGTDILVLVLGVTSWPLLARVVRAEVLSVREREFVEAAVALGASPWRALRRHVLPSAFAPSIAYLALLVGQVILLEASLGFLGLGDPNTISLGGLAGQAQRFLRVAWWLSFFPGVAIVVAVLGLNLVAEALEDRLAGR